MGRLAHLLVERRRAVLILAAVAIIAGLGLTPVFLSQLRGVDYATPGSRSYKAEQFIAAHTGYSEQDSLVFSSAHVSVRSPVFAAALARGVALVRAHHVLVAPQRQISPDGHALLATIAMKGSAAHRQTLCDQLQEALAHAMPPGVQAGVTGDSPVLGDLTNVEKNEAVGAEAVGLPVALVVLLIAFGSVVAAGLPLLLGVCGLVVSFEVIAGVMLFKSFNAFVETAMVGLGLALGIDYALLLVRRFREERAAGGSEEEVLARTLSTAGRTVMFSGTIVSAALIPLAATGLPFFGDTALALIVVVLAEVTLLLTFLPAVLLTLGDRLERGSVPARWRRDPGLPAASGRWYRWARAVMRRPLPILAGGVALMLAAASPILGLRTGIYLNTQAMSGQPSVRALDALERHFPAAAVGPIEVLVRGPVAPVRRVLAGDRQLADPVTVAIARDANVISVIPTVGTDSIAAERLVRHLRDQLQGLPAQVTGVTAETVDYAHETDRVTPWVIGAALILSLLLLTWLFRSPLLAIKAIVMNLLSVGASIGLTVLVFQDGHGERLLGFTSTGYLQAWTPLLLFMIVFGLSMDYEVFMVSRMREEWGRTGDTTEAVARGLERTGGIVTFAATIMVAIFASFMLVVIPEMKQLGFALAVAVLLDATVVRAMLVPAFMRLAGRWNWWMPRRLDRLLPQLGEAAEPAGP
ncbi:MAG TPA: MMPL family transporter [Solirubrobacteraceae bacterium]|nr:MMPL family transporter [Solirubrobacteraceae bacterium]